MLSSRKRTLATNGDYEIFAWIREFLEKDRKVEGTEKGVVEIFAKDQRIVLVPNAKFRRGKKCPNPSRAVVLDAGDEGSLGKGVAEALTRSITEVVRRKPPRDKGDVIDHETHALIGVAAKTGFFRKVKYGQIVLKEGLVTFYPSKHGALQASLPVFEAPFDEPPQLADCLQKAIEVTI